MIITTTTWPGPSVVQPTIERPTAMRLAQTEYQRVTDAVDALQHEDWARPTDCTEWDVRQLVEEGISWKHQEVELDVRVHRHEVGEQPRQHGLAGRLHRSDAQPAVAGRPDG